MIQHLIDNSKLEVAKNREGVYILNWSLSWSKTRKNVFWECRDICTSEMSAWSPLWRRDGSSQRYWGQAGNEYGVQWFSFFL